MPYVRRTSTSSRRTAKRPDTRRAYGFHAAVAVLACSWSGMGPVAQLVFKTSAVV